MWKTKVCDILGVQYPVVQAPMAWISDARLAAAVSNAGGLGTIGIYAGMSQEDTKNLDAAGKHLREQIRKARSLTSKPFAVNFTVGRGRPGDYTHKCVEVACEEGIPVAVVSAGSPSVYTRHLKETGAKVLHVVSSVEHARKAEGAGVDVVVCVGYEAGGHSGAEELTTLVLVPQVVDAIKIPVIAGGGIADARGFIAALALGAQGIYMGTRFLATVECGAHPDMKSAIIAARDTDTVTFDRKIGVMRALKNDFSLELCKMESRGASEEEMLAFWRATPGLGGHHPIPAAILDGELVHGASACGAIAGMIKQVISVDEVIKSILDEAPKILGKLDRMGKT